MKVKDVDICITTFNRNDRLKQTLEMLSKQSNMNFNLIINDDGSNSLINPNEYPIITKYIWNENDAYHRVGRFNESVSMCVSPNIIIMDDDCIPNGVNFIQSHLDTLKYNHICRGVVRFPDGSRAGAWFSTANLGIRKMVIDDIGLFDPNFDCHYGHEDQDLGNRLKKTSYTIAHGNDDTIVNHGVEIYANGDRSERIIGHNTKYFIKKWGYDPR